MDKHFFYSLVDKYLDGTASTEERKAVESYYEALSDENAPVSSEKKEFLYRKKYLEMQEIVNPPSRIFRIRRVK